MKQMSTTMMQLPKAVGVISISLLNQLYIIGHSVLGTLWGVVQRMSTNRWGGYPDPTASQYYYYLSTPKTRDYQNPAC